MEYTLSQSTELSVLMENINRLAAKVVSHVAMSIPAPAIAKI